MKRKTRQILADTGMNLRKHPTNRNFVVGPTVQAKKPLLPVSARLGSAGGGGVGGLLGSGPTSTNPVVWVHCNCCCIRTCSVCVSLQTADLISFIFTLLGNPFFPCRHVFKTCVKV